jgi:hypothetical protein
MQVAGAVVYCPGCFLDLRPLLYELIEFNPHLPRLVPPDEVRCAIELHDSEVLAADAEGFMLDAYVHRWRRKEKTWIGTGWTQSFRVDLQMADRSAVAVPPFAVAGGGWRISQEKYENLISYPVPTLGHAHITLELVQGGVVEFRGELISLRAVGEARFVETLPIDFAPLHGAG